MDQPYAEAQPYGRRIQHRQRKFHAGNKAYGKRVFRKPAHEICLSGQGMGRLDQHRDPFRASIVLGTPGSGKSYAVVNNYIKQQIEKSFAMYITTTNFRTSRR